jgi:TatA/E family protein of Tat protein translocase
LTAFEDANVPLLVFEFLGTTELLVIAFVALVVFGPRKLPELGRTLGKHLGEFKRASEDFKRTWEREVEVEKIERDLRIDTGARAALDAMPDNSASTTASDIEYHDETSNYYGASGDYPEETLSAEPQTIARSNASASPATAEAGDESRKHNWL